VAVVLAALPGTSQVKNVAASFHLRKNWTRRAQAEVCGCRNRRRAFFVHVNKGRTHGSAPAQNFCPPPLLTSQRDAHCSLLTAHYSLPNQIHRAARGRHHGGVHGAPSVPYGKFSELQECKFSFRVSCPGYLFKILWYFL